MIRILLVEDNTIVRNVINSILVLEDDFDIVGAAENGLVVLQQLDNGLQTDIVLADINMSGMDGISLTEQLSMQYPAIKVIILTMHAKSAFIQRAMAAGAKGYLLKNGDMEEVNAAIRKVYSGEVVMGVMDNMEN